MMSEREQMKKVIEDAFMEDYDLGCDPCAETVAKHLCSAGWRKQEWISVEDGLPDEGVDVIVALRIIDRVSVDTDRIYGGKWFGYGAIRGVSYVTHWMPFPEPPKMGGE